MLYFLTVDVATNAATAADRLAVLAPESVRGLRVDEPVGVDNWGDVKVKLVNESLDARVGGVLGQQLPCKVPE